MKYEGADLVFVCGHGNCCLLYVAGLSSGTSSVCDRMQEHHPVCDPAILEGGGEVDLRMDLWAQGSEDTLGMLWFRWRCKVVSRRVVVGSLGGTGGVD